MAESQRISVVIPTYNREGFIAQAVQSVLQQKEVDLEVIVVDDGSVDRTRDVLQPYLDRIHYVRQPNQGVSAARNRGIREASGDWVAFLDSDDVWRADKLALQLAACRTEKVPLCFTNVVLDRGEGKATKTMTAAPIQPPRRFDQAVRLALAEDLPTLVQSMLVRRQLLADVGGFDEAMRVAEDTKLVFELALRHPAVFLPTPLVVIDRTDERDGLTAADLTSVAQRAQGGLEVLLGVYARSTDLDAEFTRRLRRRLGQAFAQSSRALCLQGDRGGARRHALDALHFRVDARRALRSLAIAAAPGLVRPLLARRHARNDAIAPSAPSGSQAPATPPRATQIPRSVE